MVDRRRFLLRSLAAGLGGGASSRPAGSKGGPGSPGLVPGRGPAARPSCPVLDEHRWALAEAFDFHRRIGPERAERRVRELAGRLKSGLAEMDHIRLVTPSDDRLSAGIVCFDVDGMSSEAAVLRLRQAHIVATTSPYRSNHARLSSSIYNTREEVERALDAVRALRR